MFTAEVLCLLNWVAVQTTPPEFWQHSVNSKFPICASPYRIRTWVIENAENLNGFALVCEAHWNNLLVLTVKLAGSPAVTLVCALSFSSYSVSGDNPSMVPVHVSELLTLLPKLLITVSPYRIEYCVITPLVVSGGIHCNFTELMVIETTLNEHGSLGTATKIIWYIRT